MQYNGLLFLSTANEHYGQVALGGSAEKYHDHGNRNVIHVDSNSFQKFQNGLSSRLVHPHNHSVNAN